MCKVGTSRGSEPEGEFLCWDPQIARESLEQFMEGLLRGVRCWCWVAHPDAARGRRGVEAEGADGGIDVIDPREDDFVQ